MTSHTSRTEGFPAAMRIVAVAGMVGSALFAQSVMARAEDPSFPTVRMAQAMPPHVTAKPTKAAAGATEAKPDTVEQRITSLHQALMITSGQEADWKGVAEAMRENAAAMDKVVKEKAAQDPTVMDALDDLKTYQKFAQTHVDGLKNLTESFAKLYTAMPAAQKKNADTVFHNVGRGRPASNG